MNDSTTSNEIAASGLRFGIRGMIVFTAIIGAVFALISLFGALVGLIVALSVVLIALTALLLAAMVYRMARGAKVSESRLMSWFETICNSTVLLTSLLIIAVIVAGGAAGVSAILGKRAKQAAWNHELGFTHRHQSFVRDDEIVHYLEITSVRAGGTFEAAGIRRGEFIAVDQDRFFELLEVNRGGEYEFDIGAGENTGYWEDMKMRSIVLPIKEAD